MARGRRPADLPALVRRRVRRRGRRPRGRPPQARPPAVARRRRHLAVAVLPVADGRLRLRRRRLLRRRPALRRPRRLRPPARRRPRARASGCCSTGCPTTPPTSTRGSSTSRSSRDSPKRDWYVWRDGDAATTPPNNWKAAFADGPRGRATTRPASGTCTASCPSSPTSTGATPRSCDAMHDMLRFWLDRGVDGFRIDVVHLIGKDAALPDDRRPRLTSSPTTTTRARTPCSAASAACWTRTRRPDDGRRGIPASRRALIAHLLRRRRRAAPRVRLRVAARPVGRRRLARAHRARRGRSWASAGRRGCSPTTTSRACARDWAAARTAPAPPRCCC